MLLHHKKSYFISKISYCKKSSTNSGVKLRSTIENSEDFYVNEDDFSENDESVLSENEEEICRLESWTQKTFKIKFLIFFFFFVNFCKTEYKK